MKTQETSTAPGCGTHSDGEEFFRSAMSALSTAGARFMVGGSYALERHTGLARSTKDLDLFVMPRDCRETLRILGDAGYGTELTDPAWLAKVFHQGHLIDIVFNSGNRVCGVDEEWFAHGPYAEVLGLTVQLCPVEETIWQKAFIMERERYDGADVAHMILKCGADLDWNRLLGRMGEHWPVLLCHLLLFQFSYPGETEAVPPWIMTELLSRLDSRAQPAAKADHICRGTLLSRYQYLVDLSNWDYHDARLLVPRAEAA